MEEYYPYLEDEYNDRLEYLYMLEQEEIEEFNAMMNEQYDHFIQDNIECLEEMFKEYYNV
jgi:ClpP class serine protease